MKVTRVCHWERPLFLVGIAIASAQSTPIRQNVYKFPNAHVLATQQKLANHSHLLRVVINDGEKDAVKYVFLESEMPQAGYPASPEPVSFDLPRLPLGSWNEAYIQLDSHTGTYSIGNTARAKHIEMMNSWHPRRIDYLEFGKVKTLQQDRLQVVTHPDFDTPVLIKIASFPREIPSLEQEATVYRLLHDTRATPDFLGHVTEGGRVIGFVTEYIEEVPSIRNRNIYNCLAALRSLHQRGIAHGDAHDGNCLVRKDGSAVLVDFELSVETWSQEEFERDLDIMNRCIQEIFEHS
ncbi:hypothetical protein F5884DRAFT_849370 [Xylogone sp. PMI_703]|nr:hypothetical protein F5884DRAFT_849370 [Xylogone sp. PMI_703]